MGSSIVRFFFLLQKPRHLDEFRLCSSTSRAARFRKAGPHTSISNERSIGSCTVLPLSRLRNCRELTVPAGKRHFAEMHPAANNAYVNRSQTSSCSLDKRLPTARQSAPRSIRCSVSMRTPETDTSNVSSRTSVAADLSAGDAAPESTRSEDILGSIDEDEPVVDEIAVDEVIVLLLATAIGLATGLGVVLFNDLVHQIQDHLVWTSTPRLAAFGTNGLYRYPTFSPWQSLLLPPVLGGVFVAVLRGMAGGFTADPASVAHTPSNNPNPVQMEPAPQPQSPIVTTPEQGASPNALAGTLAPTQPVAPAHTVVAAPAPTPAIPGRFPRHVAAPHSTAVAITETPIRNLKSGILQWKMLQYVLRPYIKLVASAITLGSGASMGPEGPSVELGKATAERVTCIAREQRKNVATDLIAAGAGAGVAAGFGAPMSGVLFAVETVLLAPGRPAVPPGAGGAEAAEDSGVLMATVLVACVTAAVVSQAGLGLEPAFHVPAEAPLSVQELPLCVLLGLMCGTASAGFGAAVESSERSFARLRQWGWPPWLMPAAGGLACGSLAVVFPEITYQGFDNLNALLQLEDSPASAYSAGGLAALVVVKIAATAVCRGSGLVGGVYAPSLFMGAALGCSFWLFADGAVEAVAGGVSATDMWASAAGMQLSGVNGYALVGAAAMLAAACRVPLTSVLLLFELTRDYTLILPTLCAVGFARWGGGTWRRLLNSNK